MPVIIPDLSHYEKCYVDPHELDGPAFINKVSQGASFVDSTWHNRAIDILEHGELIGGYHFCTADGRADQATNFLSAVHSALGTTNIPQLKLFVDYEDYPESQPTIRRVEQIITTVMLATGRKPAVYMSLDTWKNSHSSNIIMGCDLWLAEYGPVAKAPHKLWQFTDAYTGFPAINVPCDASKWDGDVAALATWWAT